MDRVNERIKWLGMMCALVSVTTILYVKLKFIFESGNVAGKLVLLSIVTALVAGGLGIYHFRRWQSWISFFLIGIVAYVFSSPPLYMIP